MNYLKRAELRFTKKNVGGEMYEKFITIVVLLLMCLSITGKSTES